ncbi:MAG: UDP-N-acetylmuramoyl-tripeptide--D-alanyl-D-alanine ligase [Elusimicrobia bacterium]|nr:UDP-N-acetylmuramoyl-tripeptide--D-alanyl-D-alanine ligase [Elusimicrobiota bacterium]
MSQACQGKILRGNPGAAISSISIDSRKIAAGQFFWVIEGASKDGNNYVAEAAKKGALGAVVSRERFEGLPANFILVKVASGLAALGRLAGAHRALFPKTPVVAITGSNGKTSTKEMVGAVLSMKGPTAVSPGNFNNEIGCPLAILELGQQHQHAVWEMAARKKGDITHLSLMAKPNVAVLTNISSAHLETFGSVAQTFEVKAEILKGLAPRGAVIYWAEDPWLRQLPVRFPGYQYKTFGFGKDCDVCGQIENRGPQATTVSVRHRKTLCGTFSIAAVGTGPVLNALAAFCCGLHFGVAPKSILHALSQTPPAAMRGEKIRLGAKNQYIVVNDAYNANPASMTDSVLGFLRAYRGTRKIVILGEMRELGRQERNLHEEVGAAIASQAKAEHLLGETTFVAVGGSLAQALASSLSSAQSAGPVSCLTKDKALGFIKEEAARGSLPCALFFKASRAEALETLIEGLKSETL